jgi:hypothetical protein
MSTPSNAFHGCFGHRRFSVGKFAVDASELIDDSEWTQVRNKKGARLFKSDQVSKFSTNWTNLPKSIPSINLVVAFKANDHFAQVSRTHQRTNMSNKVKSENVNVIKTNIIKEVSKEEFQKLLNEIKKVNEELTNESTNIDKSLKLLANSMKISAELLLIKKRLYRLLMEFQLQRLSKKRIDSYNHSFTTLPHNKVRTTENAPYHKYNDKIMNNIDGIRKCVGDFNIKIFHAKDIKNKWNQQQDTIENFTIDDLSSILENDIDDVVLSEDFDSDNNSSDNNWTYMGATNPLYPSNRHCCRYIG